MTNRDRFFEELQRAIARGFTLAAVSVAMSCGTGSRVDGGSGGGGQGGGGGAQTARAVDGGRLAQAPGGALGCTGDAGYIGPYFGSCCTSLHCYEPSDGMCSTSQDVAPFSGVTFTPALPPGSGTCMCGSPAVEGPFAQADGGSTGCCYVVGSIGCTGRPLRDGEATIVAAVVVRADWA